MLPFQFLGFGAFRVQFDGFFQVSQGTFFVAFQQLRPSAFLVGLSKVWAVINGIVEESDGFVKLVLGDEELGQG